MTDTTSFETVRDERTFDFKVTTSLTVTSHWGTSFVPNHCDAKVSNGKVVSVTLDRLDENGWGVDDPAGPYGAELNTSFGGGQIVSPLRAKLPEIARQALTTVEAILRGNLDAN
jgi:hypothetical protein